MAGPGRPLLPQTSRFWLSGHKPKSTSRDGSSVQHLRTSIPPCLSKARWDRTLGGCSPVLWELCKTSSQGILCARSLAPKSSPPAGGACFRLQVPTTLRGASRYDWDARWTHTGSRKWPTRSRFQSLEVWWLSLCLILFSPLSHVAANRHPLIRGTGGELQRPGRRLPQLHCSYRRPSVVQFSNGRSGGLPL